MSFGLGFEKGFQKGTPLGVQSFLTSKKIKATTERDLQKQRDKLIQKNRETTMAGKLFGIETVENELTGQVELNVPEDYKFKSPSDASKLQFLPDVGSEFQKIFEDLEKEQEPEDLHINKRSEIDLDPSSPTYQQGIVTGINKETGNREKIGVDPNYQFRVKDRTVVEGVIDIDGQKIGRKGKRTKITTYENGTFDILEVGDIKGDGSDKPIETVLFESDLAEIDVKKSKALNKRNTYIQKGINKKGFGDVKQREAFREGINNDLNRVAWEYAELGSDEAQGYIKDIVTDAQATVNTQSGSVNNVSRKLFAEQKLAEVRAEYLRNEWSYSDFTSIAQFIKAKYELFIKSQDPVRDEDELQFDVPELKY